MARMEQAQGPEFKPQNHKKKVNMLYFMGILSNRKKLRRASHSHFLQGFAVLPW
jgi:hypothetical protein